VLRPHGQKKKSIGTATWKRGGLLDKWSEKTERNVIGLLQLLKGGLCYWDSVIGREGYGAYNERVKRDAVRAILTYTDEEPVSGGDGIGENKAVKTHK